MITEMHIQRFRGFKDFSMTGIKPITLLGGPNNAGKSSVLESVLLYSVVATQNYFFWLANMRNGSNTVVMHPKYVWAPLFYRFAQSSAIKIGLSCDGKPYSEMSLAKELGPTEVNYAGGLVSDENIVSLGLHYQSGQEDFQGRFIFMPLAQGGFNTIQQNTITFIPDSADTKKVNMPWKNIFYYKVGNDFPNNMTAEWVSKACMDERRKEILLHMLQCFEPDIVDVMTVLDDGTPYVYIAKKSGMKLPLRYMGDGINKAIRLLLGVLNAEHGIFLIDEIENGLYYDLYADVLSSLYQSAMDLQCQLLITTHNQQILQTSADVMHKLDRLDQLAYQRMEQYEDDKRAYAFSGEELSQAMKIDMEVR